MTHWQSILVQNARDEAMRLKHPYIRTEHLLLALLKIDETILPIHHDKLFARIDMLPKPSCGAEQKLILAEGAKRALRRAKDEISAQVVAQILLDSSPLLRRLLTEIEGHEHVATD